jgi:tripartite ATP-independent transporter DctM subunit
MLEIAIIFGIFLVLVMLGIPIAFAMGISAITILLMIGDVPMQVIIQRMFVGIDSSSLLAIPYFVVAGEIMMHGGISTRLVKFASNAVSRFRGGMGMSTVFSSMIFAGISGSAMADTTAVGSITMPAMVKKGYNKNFVASLQACAGTIGPIIPPSIQFIIYGSLTGLSIGSLFLGGVIPGILIGVSLMVASYIYAVKANIPKEAKVPVKEFLKSAKQSFWALILPIIIIGGIISGYFTATEAGMIAVVYALIVGFFGYRELKWRELPKIFADSAITSASIMIIASIAQAFGWVLAYIEFPRMSIEILSNISSNPMVVLLFIVLFFFILGFFIECVSAMIIFVPILVDIVTKFNYDPIHFAVIIVITLLIGLVTPPVGVLLSVTTAMQNTSMLKALPYVVPLVGIMLFVLLIIIFIPTLVTFLPNLFLG